jgi:hypothetical protein
VKLFATLIKDEELQGVGVERDAMRCDDSSSSASTSTTSRDGRIHAH